MGNIKYALLGATGAVGKALAAKLAERNQPFRVVGRSEERLRQDFRVYEPLVEYCTANLSDATAAARAAAGVDTIFYTVGVPYPQFEQHPKLTRVALQAAAAARVRHFVHLTQVRHDTVERPANSFRISLSDGKVCTTFGIGFQPFWNV